MAFSGQRSRRLQQEGEDLYSPPVQEDSPHQSPSRSSAAPSALYDFVDSSCRSTAPAAARISKRFDRAVLQGVNDVAKDLQDFLDQPWVAEVATTPLACPPQVEAAQPCSAYFIDVCDYAPQFDSSCLEDYLNFVTQECDQWDADDEATASKNNHRAVLDDSMTTKETDYTYTDSSLNNITTETTEVETFLGSQWLPQEQNKSSKPQKAILVERRVRFEPSPEPEIEQEVEDELSVQTEQLTVLDESPPSSHHWPFKQQSHHHPPHVVSPTSVTYFEPQESDFKPERKARDDSSSSVGTVVHSNAREEAVAQADAIVQAMVQGEQKRNPRTTKRARSRLFRNMFCRNGMAEI